MKPEFTADGVRVQTFEEIYNDLADGYRSIYGQDIVIDPDSPDGDRIALEAQQRLDIESFGAYLYTQIDPDQAVGQALNSLIKLNGLQNPPATRSQSDVTIVTDRPVTLPSGYTVQDTAGQNWITLAERSLPAGSSTVTLFSQEFGAVVAPAGTITNPVTVVLGVQSVTNPADALVGRDELTVQQLRELRNKTLETPTSSSIGRLYSALARVANVTGINVEENDTDVTNALGIPAHSLWVIVEGGAVADIVETLVKNKTGGKGMVGAITQIYVETLTRPSGTTFTIQHVMTFDRPTYVSLNVRLTATRKTAGSPVDDALIAQEIAKKAFEIGDNVQAADLYRYAYNAGDNFIPTALEVSSDGGMTWTDGRIETAPNEKFTLDAADVAVTEVIP